MEEGSRDHHRRGIDRGQYSVVVKDKRLASMVEHERMPRRARRYHRAGRTCPSRRQTASKSARKDPTRPGSKRADKATFGRRFSEVRKTCGHAKATTAIPEADRTFAGGVIGV
jgi:hypothetical protein